MKKQELLQENERLRALTASLEKELKHFKCEHERDRKRLAEIETQNRRFSEQYVEVEQQNAGLANLYVASFRLHSTLDRQEILATIQEIIINLIGSEELAIFEMDRASSALSLVASFGIEPERYQTVRLGTGIIGGVALTGQMYLSDGQSGCAASTEEAGLTACIPLKLDGKVVGTIAVFRLLQQKAGLEAIDHELFDLLAAQAGTALFSSALNLQTQA